jgi:putative heme-binding domain-containing protein
MRLPGFLSFVLTVLTLWVCLAYATFAEEVAAWIGSPHVPSQGTATSSCHFRKGFHLTSVRQGSVYLAASGRYELFLNGRRVVSRASSGELERHEITRFLTRGRNLMAIRVESTDGAVAALAARIEIADPLGQTYRWGTDESWVTNHSPLPFWYTPLYNDTRWETARQLAPLGSSPSWGDLVPSRTDPASTSSQVASRKVVPDRNRPAAARAEVVDERRQAAARAEVVDESRQAARTEIQDAPDQLPQPPLFQVPPDFEVEALLGAEATGSLIALAFNEFGHIIASRENGELLLIHDSNGDGKPDKVRVYADQVRDCHGILCLNGYVFVTGDGPEGRGVYRLHDQNRDGRADEVQTLLKLPAEIAHAGPHGLTLGSDGLLYVALGNRTEVPEQIDLSSPYRNYYEGTLIEPRFELPQREDDGLQAPGGTVLRLDIHGGQVQLVAGGLKNAYSLAFNREGDLFTLDGEVEADLGTPWYQPTSLVHVTAGAEFGWRRACSRWPGYYPDRLPAVLEVGRGTPAGMVFYHHYSFPVPYHDALFVADWSSGEIAVFTFQPHGAGYSAARAIFVQNDSRSISDLEVGPDGSLYFVTGGHGTVGGLYRIQWAGDDPPEAQDWGQGLDAVIRQPQMNSAWSRQNVAAIKKELGADWDRLLPAVAASTANPWQYRLRALDLMQLYGPVPPVELLVKIARDEEPRVRGKAAEWMGIHGGQPTEQVLVQLLDDDDGQVRRRACEALLRAGQNPPLDALIPLLKSADAAEALAARRLLENLPADSWRERLLDDGDHRLLIQGSLALMSAAPTPEHARSVLDAALATMQTFMTDEDFLDLLRVVQVALLQGEVPLSDVQPLRAQLAAEFPSADAAMNRELIRLLIYLEIPGMQDRVMEYLDDAEVAETDKLDCLLHLGFLTGTWYPEQRMRILEFFETIRDWPGGAAFAASVRQAAAEFTEPMTPEDLRLALLTGDRWPRAAFSLLYQVPERLDAETFEALKQLDRRILDSADPDVSRLKVGIAAVLARSGDDASVRYLRELWEMDPERRLAVAMGLAQHPNEENWHYLIRSLPVLDGGAAREVLVNLRSIPLSPEDPEVYRQVILRGLALGEQGGDDAIALLEFWTGVSLNGEDADGLAGTLSAWQEWYADKWPESPAAELPVYQFRGVWNRHELARYLTSGDGWSGSAEKGAELFDHVHCAKCHRFGGVGSDLAPDLTTLSRRAMRKEILESVLFPSHDVPEDFATYTVITHRGRSFSGHLVPQQETGSLLLVQRDDQVVTLESSEIEQILREPLSMMPEGLLDELTLQEIADLFAFLTGQRQQRLVENPEPSLQR